MQTKTARRKKRAIKASCPVNDRFQLMQSFFCAGSISAHAELFLCRVMPSNANLYIYRPGVQHDIERASLQGHAQQCKYYCLAVSEKVRISDRIEAYTASLIHVSHTDHFTCRVMPSNINV